MVEASLKVTLGTVTKADLALKMNFFGFDAWIGDIGGD